MAGDSTSMTFKLFGHDVSASKTMEGVADKAGKVGDKIKTGLAAGAAAGGAALIAGFMQGMQVEQVTDKMNAQLGATGQHAADLGQIAGDLWANNFGEGPEDAANALRATLSSGIIDPKATNAQIESITGNVMTLAQTFDLDLGGATNAVSQMMRTGLAKNAEEALDVITRGFQTGADKGGDFLDTLNEYGTQFRKLGLDGATATGLISQGLRAGARDSDVVADALKEFSIRAVDGSKLTAQGFKDVGLNAGKMATAIGKGGTSARDALGLTLEKLRAIPDPVKRSQAAVALFGTQAEDLGDALYALDTKKAVGELGNVGGAATRMGQELNDNAGAKIETFKRQAQQQFTELAGSIITFAQQNQTWLVPVAKVLGVVAGALLAVVAAVKVWEAVQIAAKAATVAWTAVQWLLNAALSANPIGLVIIAVMALVAAIIIAWQRSATFRAIVTAALNAVKAAWQVLWNKVASFVGWLRAAFPAIRSIITAPFSAAKNWIVSAWNSVLSMFRSAPGRIAGYARGMWNGITSSFRGAINNIIGWWNRLSFSFPSINLGPMGSFGGWTVGTPDIPYLAKGGVVNRPTLAMIGEAGPEAVVPLGRGGAGMGVNVYVTAGAVGSKEELARTIVDALKTAQARGLKLGTV